MQFVAREHAALFKCVTDIYKFAIRAHNIVGPILVILIEDEFEVKQHIGWESKWDSLAGFCGAKENHLSVSNFNLVAGVGDTRYNAIVDSFRPNGMGGGGF